MSLWDGFSGVKPLSNFLLSAVPSNTQNITGAMAGPQPENREFELSPAYQSKAKRNGDP